MTLPMHEWTVVLIAGGVGGLIHGVRGQRVLNIPYIARDHRGHLYCDFGTFGVMLKAILNGAAAGLVFWGMYDATAAWATQLADVRVTAVSLVVGLGGDRFLNMIADKQLNELSGKNMGEAFERLADPDPARSEAQNTTPAPTVDKQSDPKTTHRPKKHKG